MTGRFKAAVVFVLAACLLGAQSRTLRPSAIKIGIVQDRTGFENGGCELLRPSDTYSSERYIFLSDFESHAIVNIGGRDTMLALVRSNEPNKEARKGDRWTSWYRGDRIQVRVDYVVSSLCPPDDESCEVVYYRATIVVTRGATTRTVAAYGLCGT